MRARSGRALLPALLLGCLLVCLPGLTACAAHAVTAAVPTAASADAAPTPCAHGAWSGGCCIFCGEVCPHETWVDGVCARCGMVCPHETWVNGVCARCGMVCTHPSRDPDTGVCSVCGMALPSPALRNAAGTFETEELPQDLFSPCSAQGTVELLSYSTHDYGQEERTGVLYPLEKQLAVYLPCGYDPGERYDVLVLVHGMGGSETYWLLGKQEYYGPGSDPVYTTDLLDNMISRGLCRPLIVATPTFYRDSARPGDYQRLREQAQFARELREDILPLLARTYSTYAADGSAEALTAARAHFAYAGLSMGSIYAYNAVLPDCLDLFGWFGCFSGSECDVDQVAAAVNAQEEAGYPVYCFYNCAGTADSMGPPHYAQYTQLLALCPGLTDGENAAFTDIQGAGHEYRAWGTGLYNFLQVVFRG